MMEGRCSHGAGARARALPYPAAVAICARCRSARTPQHARRMPPATICCPIPQYATRPFTLGDRVILRAGGMVAAMGTVVAVHPTRTVIAGRADAEHGGGASTVFVSNGDIVEVGLRALCVCERERVHGELPGDCLWVELAKRQLVAQASVMHAAILRRARLSRAPPPSHAECRA